MSERRNKDILLNTSDPLLFARFAVDTDYQESEAAANRMLHQGVRIDTLLRQDYQSEVVQLATTILDAQTATDRELPFYSLKSILATPKQQIFGKIVFGKFGGEYVRSKLHTKTYGVYTNLLGEASSELEQDLTPSHRKHLVEYMGRLTVLALLCRENPGLEGATMATAIADTQFNSQIRFRYIDSNNKANAASLRVIANPAMVHKPPQGVMGDPKTIELNLTRIFGGLNEAANVATTLGKESQNETLHTEEQQQYLSDATKTLKDAMLPYINLKN